jgi:ribosome-associated protein
MHDLPVNASLTIPARELVVRATRAGGPGGQHVNTSSTRVEVVWNVLRTSALDAERRDRIVARLGRRLDGEGNLRVVSAESRSQRHNREAAAERLAAVVARALHVPTRRRPTRPTAAARRQRLEAKRKRSERKRMRKTGADEE